MDGTVRQGCRVTCFDLAPTPLGSTLPPEAKNCRTHVSRPKDIAIVCLALSSGVLAFVAWRQRVEMQRLTAFVNAPRAAPGATVTIHGASTRSFGVPPRRAPAAPLSVQSGSEDEMFGAMSAAEVRAPAPRARRGGALARLMDNTEFVQALGLQRYAMLDARFAGLFRQLNLDAAELATFKHLLAEKDNVVLDVVTVSEASPEGPLPPEVLRASVRAAQEQVEQAIHSSLGSERYAIYRDYERTIAQRATVAQLEQRLSYTAAPLTPVQSEALVKILVATAPTSTAETTPAVSVVVRAGVPEAVPLPPTNAATGRVTETAVAQAQTVLTPAQMTALREIQTEQQAAIKAAELIRVAVPAQGETPTFGLTLLLQ